MLLALAPSKSENAASYLAPLFPDVRRHAELRRESVRSFADGTEFYFESAIGHISSDRREDIVVEAAFKAAKNHALAWGNAKGV